MTWWRADAALGYLDGPRGRMIKRHGVRVLYYHGIVENRGDTRLDRNFTTLEDFRHHVRFLSRHPVLTLGEIHAGLGDGPSLPPDAVAITFDDGFANNLIAAEILAATQTPWSLFVSTGPIDGKGTIWTVELALLILHGQLSSESLHHGADRSSLASRRERERAFDSVRQHLKTLPSPKRRTILEEMEEQFRSGELDRLRHEHPHFRMLSWNELSQLAADGVEIGSHGVNHEIHHSEQSSETIHEELSQSKKDIESRLETDCNYFAYPNGDTNPRSDRDVERAGYRLALSTTAGCIKPDSPRFRLPRLNGSGSTRTLARRFHWQADA